MSYGMRAKYSIAIDESAKYRLHSFFVKFYGNVSLSKCPNNYSNVKIRLVYQIYFVLLRCFAYGKLKKKRIYILKYTTFEYFYKDYVEYHGWIHGLLGESSPCVQTLIKQVSLIFISASFNFWSTIVDLFDLQFRTKW